MTVDNFAQDSFMVSNFADILLSPSSKGFRFGSTADGGGGGGGFGLGMVSLQLTNQQHQTCQ
jgi:hypothetical protein